MGAHHISSLIVHVAVRMRTTNALDGVLDVVPKVVKEKSVVQSGVRWCDAVVGGYT